MVEKALSIKVEGIPQVKKFLNNKNKRTKVLVKKGMTNSAIFLQGEVKESIAGRKAEHTSVDTGRFLNSVDFTSHPDNAKVFSKLPYARKLEYGTDFKNSPRKHFRNSASRSSPKIRQIIQRQINKI